MPAHVPKPDIETLRGASSSHDHARDSKASTSVEASTVDVDFLPGSRVETTAS